MGALNEKRCKKDTKKFCPYKFITLTKKKITKFFIFFLVGVM